MVASAVDGIEIPKFLNATPHAREVRSYFYKMACEGMMGGVRAGLSRMLVRITIPELNPEMDVYRIGTQLEMVREMANVLAEDGKKVKAGAPSVCRQQELSPMWSSR